MQKTLIYPFIVLVIILKSTIYNYAQTGQEANNLRKLGVFSSQASNPVIEIKVKPLQGIKLTQKEKDLKDSINDEDSTKKDDVSTKEIVGKIVERKYKLKEKYWWDSDSALYDYSDDIGKKIIAYSGVINTLEDSLKSEQYVSEKYRGYYRLSVLLRDKVKPKNDSVLTEFKRYKGLMRKLFNKKTDEKGEIDIIEEKFKFQKMSLDASYEELKSVIDNFETERNKLNEKLKAIEDNKKSDKQALAAIPSISSALGRVTPSISLVGQSTFNSQNWFGEVKLFTGSTQLKNEVENIFIPEASKWGVIINFTRTFDDKNKSWSGNLSVGYLGKDLYKITPNEKDKTKSDTSTFSVSTFHFKGGFQKILAKDFMSVYVNHNLLWITEGYKPFKEIFDSTNGLVNFYDAGIKCYVNLNAGKTVSLSLDLGFIFVNDKIKTYIKSEDRVIPNFKIGLRSDVRL